MLEVGIFCQMKRRKATNFCRWNLGLRLGHHLLFISENLRSFAVKNPSLSTL